MARIRPAKSQTETGKGVTPPPTPAPARRKRPAERKPRPVRPAQQRAKVDKTGSVTKAVQVSRASRFFSEVMAELKKVSWPTRNQLAQATAVVIVCVAVVAFYLWVLDSAFRRLVDAVF
jgi:preprotein translocase subunit SecE